MAALRLTMIALGAAVAMSACAGDDGYYDRPRLGPGYVEVGENRRIGVSYLPDMQAALLTFTIIGSFSVGAEEPEPPTEAEWREAAEAAAPEGCSLASLEREADDAYRAVYDCPSGTPG